jgi:four helix bundle protein
MNPTALPYAKSFRELVVYQKQRQLAREVFRVSKAFPAEERFSLTDQLRRSARSIGAQIAESWAKRRYEKHFVAKLSDADAEQMETQHWLETAKDDGYLTSTDHTRLLGLCEEIGRMLSSMMANSASFCGDSTLREDPPSYNSSEPDSASLSQLDTDY